MGEVNFRVPFDEDYIEQLREIAEEKDTTVGQLIMQTVQKKYPPRQEAYYEPRRIRPLVWIIAVCVLALAICIPLGIWLLSAPQKPAQPPAPEKPASDVVEDGSVMARRVCIIHDLGVELTYGRGYDYHGKVKENSASAFTGLIPAELVAGGLEGANITYTVWNAEKRYVRGDWKFDSFYVIPKYGDVYVTLELACSSVETAPCCYTNIPVTMSGEAKTFEILGDSYSAFDTDIVAGNSAYYGATGQVNDPNFGTANDLTERSQMWYALLEQYTGWSMMKNDSWSGSCISYSYYGGGKNDPHGNSFITRAEQRFGGENAAPAPDVLFVFGGTNDAGCGAPLGEAMYEGWTQEDLNEILPATCYLLDYLQKNAPETRVIFVMNWVNRPEVMTGIRDVCDHYGVEYVDFCPGAIDKIESHPSVAGMEQIAGNILYALAQKN